MSHDVPELSTRHIQAIEMLVAGQKTGAVAIALKMDRRTLQRWQYENEAFAAELQEQQREVTDASIRRLRSAAIAAADTIIALMKSADEGDHVRLRAAQDVLDRIHGKATQRVAGGGDGAEPLTFILRHPGNDQRNGSHTNGHYSEVS